MNTELFCLCFSMEYRSEKFSAAGLCLLMSGLTPQGDPCFGTGKEQNSSAVSMLELEAAMCINMH